MSGQVLDYYCDFRITEYSFIPSLFFVCVYIGSVIRIEKSFSVCNISSFFKGSGASSRLFKIDELFYQVILQ